MLIYLARRVADGFSLPVIMVVATVVAGATHGAAVMRGGGKIVTLW